jgi:hypothetical protein
VGPKIAQNVNLFFSAALAKIFEIVKLPAVKQHVPIVLKMSVNLVFSFPRARYQQHSSFLVTILCNFDPVADSLMYL